MFAIVSIAKKQYMVSVGDTIAVPHLEGKAGDELKFSDVLLVSHDDGKTDIGTPSVKGALVKGTIALQRKGEKINVRRYKSKVRERRSIGFRPVVTDITITAIS